MRIEWKAMNSAPFAANGAGPGPDAFIVGLFSNRFAGGAIAMPYPQGMIPITRFLAPEFKRRFARILARGGFYGRGVR